MDTQRTTQTTPGSAGPGDAARPPTPGDLLRALPAEANERGSQFVSAKAMQAKLFSVYDAAAAAEDALALVQEQLSLTLSRSYYEPDEVTAMAARLDDLLASRTEDRAGAASADPASSEA